ncbi:hypothetical protein niasHT_012514 [Heterodera trifolii]|uniref:Uncharacterized protein n=1 Tax=Heterodera trifolii TaxID=157864 RepID=A0ABD2LE17_9BILA
MMASVILTVAFIVIADTAPVQKKKTMIEQFIAEIGSLISGFNETEFARAAAMEQHSAEKRESGTVGDELPKVVTKKGFSLEDELEEFGRDDEDEEEKEDSEEIEFMARKKRENADDATVKNITQMNQEILKAMMKIYHEIIGKV